MARREEHRCTDAAQPRSRHGRPWRLLLALLVLALACLPPAVAAWAQDRAQALQPISIGFARHAYGTWTVKITDGGFETATGRTLRWLPFETDSAIAAAMAAGRLDIGLIGASVAAASISRGLDLKIFYVAGGSAESEGLVFSGDTPIRAGDPKALHNKVVAVPFGSTAHFRLLQSLRRWQVGLSSVRMVNLQPPQILEAWTRREIDTAAVSEPALGLLKASGRSMPLPPVGGREGLLVLAASSAFCKEHSVFLARFVDVMSRADSAFSDASGPLNEDRQEIRAIAYVTGLTPGAVIEAIARYRPPSLEDQVTQRWLGGGAAASMAAELKTNAEIWKWGGRIERIDIDFAKAITPVIVEHALSFAR